MPCPARRGQANELTLTVEVKLLGLSSATTSILRQKAEPNQLEELLAGGAPTHGSCEPRR